jgi:hypothetical protein
MIAAETGRMCRPRFASPCRLVYRKSWVNRVNAVYQLHTRYRGLAMANVYRFPPRVLETVSKRLLILIAGMTLLFLPATALAQFIRNPVQDASGAVSDLASKNGGPVPGQDGSLTPEQIRSIMAYRALKSRARGQVQRGVPQFVPLGALGFSPFPRMIGAANQQQPNAQPQTARQRRIEASRATARKRRAELDAAKAKAKAKRKAAKP